jgi:hypothetical protein
MSRFCAKSKRNWGFDNKRSTVYKSFEIDRGIEVIASDQKSNENKGGK